MPKEKKETISQELTIIDKPSQAITLYKITPAEIAERLKKYDSLMVIKGDSKSYKEVRGVLTALVHTRSEVETRRLKLGREYRGLVDKSISNINKASEMLSNPMAPYEERFRSELKTEDARVDAIKAEKEAKEEARINNIQAKITLIFRMQLALNMATLVELKKLSDELEDMDIGHDEYMEFTEEARKAQDNSYNAIQDAISTRIKLDKEEADRKAKDERLKEVAKKQEAAQAKIDAANKKIKDDQAKLEADKKAEDERKKREAFEKATTEKAEAAAAQKVKDDAKEKEEEEKAAEVEKAKKAAMAPDKEKLIKFADKILDVELPTLKSHKANKILSDANNSLAELATDIRKQAKEL